MFGGEMLISKEIITKWNSKTKKYYESLGYQYTKMRDSFTVLVTDLKENSFEKIIIQCDYCGRQFPITYSTWNMCRRNSPIDKDVCGKCKHLKAKESILQTYGASNIMNIPGVEEKRDATNILLYGFKNVFQSEKIKEKIFETNFEKYGVKSFTQTEMYNKQRKETCLEKYGVDSHMKLDKFKDMFRGDKSPVWKGGVHDERWDRLQPDYKEWRDGVFGRDGYLCQKCLTRKSYTEAHHIFNWNDNPDKRYDLENGITFCRDCHIEFHRQYGKKNNN
jgi:hypothetical protein